jgi:transcriptional regulator GlxA family with amidase domain
VVIESVGVLALPGTEPFELGVLVEVFGTDRTQRTPPGPRFDFRVVTPTPGILETGLGFAMVVNDGLDAAAEVDLLAIPMYPGPGQVPEEALDFVRETHDRGAWILSMCVGAFVLGEAGLLDGRRCTTHWAHADELSRRFPEAKVDPGVLYVEDGTVITSAGTAAGIDASLHLVRRELGAHAANMIASYMVVPPHRDGGQAQYIAPPPSARHAGDLAPVLDWMVVHLAEDLPVERVAAHAVMSTRTFARRFREETGATPAAWLNTQRVLRARHVLETSDLPVESVAQRCGFASAALLRHHFIRSIGTTPQRYRRQFAR